MLMIWLQDEGASSFLQWFIEESNRGMAGAEDTAMSWVITGAVIAVLVTGVMMLIKWFRKERAPMVKKIWPLPKVFLFMFVGMFPLFFVLLTIYYFDLNFPMVIGTSGFFKGVVFAWLLYLIFMISGDFITPWSRPDWARKRRV
jgi:hypothetical protein